MWKYSGGMDLAHMFRFAEVDHAKWEKKCKSLKTEAAKAESAGLLNNIHNEHNADSVSSFNKTNNGSLNFCIPNERISVSSSVLSSILEAGPSFGGRQGDAKCLKKSTDYTDNQHSSNSLCDGSAHSGTRIIANGDMSPGLLNLTRISSTSEATMEGNVHTGAPPPWFDATIGDQLDPTRNPESRHSGFSKAGKSKLNPKRVGAAWAERRKLELEMERRGELTSTSYDANWLPNFGRVWQSGTRKESRKEFRMENRATVEGDNQSAAPLLLQPYVSKRMRKDTSK